MRLAPRGRFEAEADTHPRHPFHYVLCDRCTRRVFNDMDEPEYQALLGPDGYARDDARHAGCGGFLIPITCPESSPSYVFRP